MKKVLGPIVCWMLGQMRKNHSVDSGKTLSLGVNNMPRGGLRFQIKIEENTFSSESLWETAY